jgi:ribonuclease HII
MLRFSFFRFAPPTRTTITAKTDLRKMIKKFQLDPVEAKQNLIIVGCDETGTGCLAGPLMASAFCVLPLSLSPPPPPSQHHLPLRHKQEKDDATLFEMPEDQILDSKVLAPKQRDKIFEDLSRQENISCISSTEVASVDLINGIGNITHIRLNFLSNAVRSVVSKVKKLPTFDPSRHLFCVVVDGQEMPEDLPLDFPLAFSTAKGDSKYLCVAAASIIAKVRRDREMIALAKEFPDWGFELHKGYGNRDHVDKCIEKLEKGEPLTIAHREGFVRNLKLNREISERMKSSFQ